MSCSNYNNIVKGKLVIEISSDASSFGWENVYNKIFTGGAFNFDEMEYHINSKVILAANFSLKTFVKVPDAHDKLLSDENTAVYGINNIHSIKSDLCHFIISEIWDWCWVLISRGSKTSSVICSHYWQ